MNSILGRADMAEERDFGIDPVQYGILCQRVQDMGKKIDKMERQLEELVALANKSRGGLWFGMGIISSIAAVVGFAVSNFKTY